MHAFLHCAASTWCFCLLKLWMKLICSRCKLKAREQDLLLILSEAHGIVYCAVQISCNIGFCGRILYCYLVTIQVKSTEQYFPLACFSLTLVFFDWQKWFWDICARALLEVIIISRYRLKFKWLRDQLTSFRDPRRAALPMRHVHLVIMQIKVDNKFCGKKSLYTLRHRCVI